MGLSTVYVGVETFGKSEHIPVDTIFRSNTRLLCSYSLYPRRKQRGFYDAIR